MNSYTKMLSWSASALSSTLLALTALSAAAQTTTAPPASRTPETIGVDPQTGREAIEKAVPRSDTGTVVRTAPGPADQTRSAVDNATNGAANADRSATGTLDTTAAPDASVNTTRAAPRLPRADRN